MANALVIGRVNWSRVTVSMESSGHRWVVRWNASAMHPTPIVGQWSPFQYPEVSDITRCQSAWAREGPWEYARVVRAGPLQKVIPWSGEAIVCDSGQEIDKIGIGSVGSGSSKVRSVSTAGQCSNARRSSLKCGGRGWVAVCNSSRGIAPESGRKW